jgi:ribosomal protein S18 acetylase RimI-like enzyme
MDPLSQTLVTTYLEMNSRDAFRPAYLSDDSLRVDWMSGPDLEYYRFLYRSVGERWRWRDRLLLSDVELTATLTDPGLRIEVLYAGGAPAGFIELLRAEDDQVEIAYFGLREGYMGRGYGKHLLSHGVDRAWQDGAKRVWLHTCNLDGPHALANYRARGFTIYDVKEEPMPGRYL